METIKSYSDLQQSKKLAEFLPCKSADMHYWRKGQILGVGHSKEMQEGFESKGIDYTPCWSLAALLDVLKDKIIFGSNTPKGWFCCYTIKNPTKTLTIYEDSLVDACVTMIEKLNELKML